MTYLWQLPDWPNFVWDDQAFERAAYEYAVDASRLMGAVAQLSQQDQTDAVIDLMVSEAIKTSQIEGEHFDRSDVRSSIRNQLGLNASPEAVRDPKAQGIAALMVSIRQTFAEPLTESRLCAWQDQIIVGPYDRTRLEAGRYRTTAEPMQIISGAIGKEKVHYEAPPSAQVPPEMARFVSWFNASRDLKGIVRAGVAHLYFECIHPFADGNGRVGRAISEVALSRSWGARL